MIRRRGAIEPAIGYMKADGKLDRNWLKGALGDAISAALYGAGHDPRMILRKLRLFCSLILAVLLTCQTAALSAAWVIPPLLTRVRSRVYAAAMSRCFGVIPPKPMLGRS